MKKRLLFIVLASIMFMSACSNNIKNKEQEVQKIENINVVDKSSDSNSELIYGSKNFTTINPAMYEHGEINALLFNGLTMHDENNKVVPSLAKSWDYDDNTKTYTFYLRDDVRWHDGEKFSADDVKFTIDAIKDPKYDSENAPNYEDITNIEVVDDYTIKFTLKNTNMAFLDYMSISILPKHLLEKEDMYESEFFTHPVGTGPYKLEKWDVGEALILKKNSDYFLGEQKIDTIVFKIIEDDNAKALQLRNKEIDLALLDPKNAQYFKNKPDYTCYNMTTSDYRGLMFNFNNDFWKKNKDIIPAICYGIDRQSIVKSVLLGQGMVAYGPLERNEFNNENVEKYEYNPQKAEEILKSLNCSINKNGYYERNGSELDLVITVMSGEQERLEIAQAVAQQLRNIHLNCSVDVPAKVDWDNQQIHLIGWGSPFDADDHTYKVFGSNMPANYSSYSNKKVDEYLTKARQTSDREERKKYYDLFQEELANDPAYAFICYLDANYVGLSKIKGIDTNKVLGHHGVGIFWNINEWSID